MASATIVEALPTCTCSVDRLVCSRCLVARGYTRTGLCVFEGCPYICFGGLACCGMHADTTEPRAEILLGPNPRAEGLEHQAHSEEPKYGPDCVCVDYSDGVCTACLSSRGWKRREFCQTSGCTNPRVVNNPVCVFHFASHARKLNEEYEDIVGLCEVCDVRVPLSIKDNIAVCGECASHTMF